MLASKFVTVAVPMTFLGPTDNDPAYTTYKGWYSFRDRRGAMKTFDVLAADTTGRRLSSIELVD